MSYVDKQASKSKADRAKELKRLQNMKPREVGHGRGLGQRQQKIAKMDAAANNFARAVRALRGGRGCRWRRTAAATAP